jgi:predicted ATP-dependent protease
VVSAVEAGQFHIYAVKEVDDALTILTGKVAGALSSKGRYPRDSVNNVATQQLRRIADIVNGDDQD